MRPWRSLLEALVPLVVLATAAPRAGAADAVERPSPPSGWAALVGLQRVAQPSDPDLPEGRVRWRTLWVRPGHTGYRVGSSSDLLVRRADGLWRIARVEHVRQRGVIEAIWVGPADLAPTFPAPPPDNCPDGHFANRFTLLFVGPDHLAYERDDEDACVAENRRPMRVQAIGVSPLDRPFHPLPIDAVAGAEARALLDREGVPADSWALARRYGQWAVRARLAPSCRTCSMLPRDLDIPIAPPAAVVGPQGPAVDWFEFKARASAVTDLFVSPGGDVRITEFHSATWHRLDVARKEGSLFFGAEEYLLAPNEHVVLLQWVTGADEVERWTRELQRVFR